MSISGFKLDGVEILAVDLTSPEIDASIGRNVSNKLKVELNGRGGLFSIQDP